MGMDKALLPFRGRTFLECLVEQCRFLSRHVCISIAGDRGEKLQRGYESRDNFRGVLWAPDRHHEKGPLSGIEAGLKILEPACRFALVIGCDVPVLKPALAKEMLRVAIQNDSRAVTPVDRGRVFGVTAVYRTDSWNVAAELIDQNSLRVTRLAEKLDSRRIELSDLRQFDPKLESFLNINDPEAYRNFLISQNCEVDANLIQRLITKAR